MKPVCTTALTMNMPHVISAPPPKKKLDQSDFLKSEFFLAARPVDLMTTAPCVLNVPGTSRIASIVPVVLTL